MSDDRATTAERLLRASGMRSARVRTAGHRGEIAAVAASLGDFEAIQRLAAAVKALGFQYVALELTTGEEAE